MQKRLFALLLAVWLAVLPADADAGQTAHYRHDRTGGTILVEVQGDDARLHIAGQPWYLLISGGDSFWVYDLPTPTVVRVADFERAIREGHVALPPVAASRATYQFVPGGELVIAGYRGRAYHVGDAAGAASRPSLVLSSDTALAALGRPLARHMASALLQVRLSGGAVSPAMLQVRELLNQGTALLFLGYRLERVETGDIGRERFAFPAAPLAYEETLRTSRQSGLIR